jgi:transportin-1
MTDPNNKVRQSSYALLGDCSVHLLPQLQPYLPNVLPALIKQLDLDLIHDEEPQTGFSVLNNACWSCGEIAVPVSRPVVSGTVNNHHQHLQ